MLLKVEILWCSKCFLLNSYPVPSPCVNDLSLSDILSCNLVNTCIVFS